jgi:hypothetical protein
MTGRLFILLSVLAAAFQTAPGNGPQVGTARIGGVIVDANDQPVPRAIVRLSSAELPTAEAAVTDERGRFMFDRLPAGRFSVTASKLAYLTSNYGAVRPGGTGTPLALTGGQELAGLKLVMPHGGAIGGVIRDSDGEALRGMSVYAQRVGTPTASRTDAVFTDDRGAYRIFGLGPGDYYIYAQAGYLGGIGEVGIMSASEVDAVFTRLKSRNPATSVTSAERTASSIVRPSRSFIPSPVFYPGVTTMSRAAPVTLALSEVRDGVDVRYDLAPSASIKGTLTGAGAQTVSLALINEDGQPPSPLGFNGPNLQRRPPGDGAFEFTSVTPGKYTVIARVIPRSPASGPPSSEPQLFATASLDINGTDVTGLSLVLQPTARIRGRLTFEAGTQPMVQTMSGFQLRLLAAGSTPTSNTQISPLQGLSVEITSVMASDGTFLIDGVLPGSYRLAYRDLPGWRVRSAKLGDVDVLDTAFDVSADISGIEVTLTDRHSRLSGRLSQQDGTAASGYFVIVFSADRSFWASQSRRVRSIRPGTDGEFRLDDLPAGEYYLAALTDADSDDWQTEAFLTHVISSAVRVSLGDGEQKIQDLRIGRH